MRILLTLHHYLDANSGAPGTTLMLADALRRAGHHVEIISFDDLPAALSPWAKGVVFPELAARALRRRVRASKIDVVDASSGDAWVWVAIRDHGARAGPLLVTRSHGLEHIAHLERLEERRRGALHLRRRYFLYHGGFRLREVAWSTRGADIATFLNETDRAHAVWHLGVRPERAFVVSNGLPSAFLGRPLVPPEQRSFEIVQIGTYLHMKGVRYGAVALNRILAHDDAARVTFLGTGVDAEAVRRDFTEEIRPLVHVVPHYSKRELLDLLPGKHVEVFPSLSEGFGVALTEAMSLGVVPVAAASGGARAVVEDGRTGLLVPPRDAGALERGILYLRAHPAELDRMRRAAHEAVQRLSWDRIAGERTALYERGFELRRATGI